MLLMPAAFFFVNQPGTSGDRKYLSLFVTYQHPVQHSTWLDLVEFLLREELKSLTEKQVRVHHDVDVQFLTASRLQGPLQRAVHPFSGMFCKHWWCSFWVCCST